MRWLGAVLLVSGLLLPWLILVWRAAERSLPQMIEGPVTLRPEMVALPAGSFLMGSPPEEEGHDDDERLHEVRISRPFMISRTEVTQGQHSAVMGEKAMHRRYANVRDKSAKAIDRYGNYFSCDDGYPRLAPATAKDANGWHLHGLGGNASEWARKLFRRRARESEGVGSWSGRGDFDGLGSATHATQLRLN